MSHAHAHPHAHAEPAPGSENRALALGITLNVGFVAVEAALGVVARSTALLADAAHNLSDVLGLLMAWGAAALARRAPSSAHTYGLRRSTVLAALANAVLLLVAVGAVAWEAIGRFAAPHAPDGVTMIWVAAVGVAVNGLSAWLLRASHAHDLNMRGAFLHLLADAAVSAGVVVAGVAVWLWGLRWIDPATSLLVSAVVLYGTWKLLRDALHLALDGVPRHIELEAIRAFLSGLPQVEAVHDLHVWAMSTTETALTAHLVMPWQSCPPAFLSELHREIEARFGITHTTVQIEPSSGDPCARCCADGI